MNIKFTNGTNFEYGNAFALENDYHKNIKRPSLEIHFPIEVITYEELKEIISNPVNLEEIVLTGDSVILENNEVYTPQNIYYDYNIKGKITVDDEEITVKLYKKSDLELENEEAMAIIDELLIVMEV